MPELESRKRQFYLVGAAILASLLVGAIFILAAGENPLNAYYWLFHRGVRL